MQITRPISVFLLLAVLSDLLSSLEAVTVKYSREPVTKVEGESLTLSCTVLYEPQQCRDIQSTWCLLPTPEDCVPLTDSYRYLIQVNETIEKKQLRQRKIFITFNSLTLEDSGYYQCNAKCVSGTEGKGHLVNLNVTGFKVSNWSKRIKPDTALFLLCVILLMWSY